MFPLLISFGLQYRVTFDRIQEFLVEPELPKRPKEDNKPGKHAIVFENASFSYTPEDPNAPLAVKNVNLKVHIQFISISVNNIQLLTRYLHD